MPRRGGGETFVAGVSGQREDKGEDPAGEDVEGAASADAAADTARGQRAEPWNRFVVIEGSSERGEQAAALGGGGQEAGRGKESGHGMVGGADAGAVPGTGADRAFPPWIAGAEPGRFERGDLIVVEPAEVSVGGGEGEEPGGAEEDAARQRQPFAARVFLDEGFQFNQRHVHGQRPHRLAVGGEAETVEHLLPEDFGRRRGGEPGLQPGGPRGEAKVAEAEQRIAQQTGPGAGEVFGAGGAADPVPIPPREIGKAGEVGPRGDGDRHQRAIGAPRLGAVVVEDEVEDDGVVGGIAPVAVLYPAAGAKVDLDTPGAQLAAGEEEQRVAEVGTESVRPGAAVDDLDRFTVERHKRGGNLPGVPGGAEGDLGGIASGHAPVLVQLSIGVACLAHAAAQ